MDKKIETLRIFFRTSNAAFSFAEHIQSIFGKPTIPTNKMQFLHKMALEEIEKENPDLSIIDNLLAEMEQEDEANKRPMPPFKKGGFIDQSGEPGAEFIVHEHGRAHGKNSKMKAELIREIVTLWLEPDGRQLEKLSIAELKEVKDLQQKVNDYIKLHI